jgi:hypothetical protein
MHAAVLELLLFKKGSVFLIQIEVFGLQGIQGVLGIHEAKFKLLKHSSELVVVGTER